MKFPRVQLVNCVSKDWMSGGSHRDAAGMSLGLIQRPKNDRGKAYSHRPTVGVVDISDGMSRPTVRGCCVDMQAGMQTHYGVQLVMIDAPKRSHSVLKKLLGLCSGHSAALCSAASETNLEKARPGRNPCEKRIEHRQTMMRTRRHERCQDVIELLSIHVEASCLTPLGKRRKRAAGRGAGAGRKLGRALSGGRHFDGLFWCCDSCCCCCCRYSCG